MIHMTSSEPTSAEGARLERVTALLGGDRVLHHKVRTALDAHKMLYRGLPGESLTFLLGRLTTIKKTASIEKAVGMSMRTFQRRKDVLLSKEQSGRTWKFAEILAKATELFGSQEEAELWLERPAMALDQQRPIDLLETPAGVELIEDFLTRTEYGVYQ